MVERRAAGGAGDVEGFDGQPHRPRTLTYARDGVTCCACGMAEELTGSGSAASSEGARQEPVTPSALIAEARLAELRQRRGKWTGHRVVLEHLRFVAPRWVPEHQLRSAELEGPAGQVHWLGVQGDRRTRELYQLGALERRVMADETAEFRFPPD